MENFYIGRQPIYDRQLEVFAYELLFRCPGAPLPGGDAMTAQIILNSVMDLGLDAVAGDRTVFINLTSGFLDGSYPLPFTPHQVALEDVEPTPAVLNHLRELVRGGYTIALDDFQFRPGIEALLPFAKLVKLDVLALDEHELRDHIERLRPFGVKLVAEKLESHDEFELCRELGFDYFQGYFLAKPYVMEARRAGTHRLVVLQLLARLHHPRAEFSDLEAIIIRDVALAYRLLRYTNSAAFALQREVASVRDALLLLGTETIRNWASLILLSRVSDKPRDLLNTALIRARMCEQLARLTGQREPQQYFTAGLLSVLDALMDQPMERVINTLPLVHDIKRALVEQRGPIGDALSRVLHYERADWDKLDGGGLEPSAYTRSFIEAVRWVADTAPALHAPA
ncbi:MAG: HDOD domain-containing protein [Gammaproteobacteria bacterium]|nr:HDOD domain-containing protein [Gammaproteobacteria bacterium]